MTNEMIQQRVAEFIERSKELGIKVTPQRIAIYRTLETFENLGLISVVNVLYNAARYDANLDPHHHIVCTECKKVEDVYDECLNNLDISNKTLGDYKVEGYSLLLSGVCTSCRSN